MTRTLIITIGVIILLIGGFFAYQQFFVQTDTALLTSTGPREDLPGKDIIAQLNRLPTDLDGSIFSDPGYKQLVDGTVALQPVPAGRNNPFAPIFFASQNTRR